MSGCHFNLIPRNLNFLKVLETHDTLIFRTFNLTINSNRVAAPITVTAAKTRAAHCVLSPDNFFVLNSRESNPACALANWNCEYTACVYM